MKTVHNPKAKRTVKSSRKYQPEHTKLPVHVKLVWKAENYGALARIAREQGVMRSVVSEAFRGHKRSYSPAGLRVHRALDRAIFGKPCK